MKNAKIQTPEVVTYEVRWKSRDNRIEKRQFTTEMSALIYRAGLNKSSTPPLWSEVYRIRTKKT